jgi:hypothetical protein
LGVGYNGLYFPKKSSYAEPGSIECLSRVRKIALWCYRSCFGTPNVYADLKPDVLFLSLGTALISEPFGNGVIALLVVPGRVIRCDRKSWQIRRKSSEWESNTLNDGLIMITVDMETNAITRVVEVS